jgi:hypothetical protein
VRNAPSPRFQGTVGYSPQVVAHRRPGRRFTALLALSTVAALAVGPLAGAGVSGPEATCAKVRAEARTGTPEEVAILFITSGVLRINSGCAYDLVTPALRKTRPRAAFVSGEAVTVYRTSRPKAVTAQFTPRVRLSNQVGSWITLDAPDRKPRTFEIVLRKRDGRWLVDYWAHAVGFD